MKTVSDVASLIEQQYDLKIILNSDDDSDDYASDHSGDSYPTLQLSEVYSIYPSVHQNNQLLTAAAKLDSYPVRTAPLTKLQTIFTFIIPLIASFIESFFWVGVLTKLGWFSYFKSGLSLEGRILFSIVIMPSDFALEHHELREYIGEINQENGRSCLKQLCGFCNSGTAAAIVPAFAEAFIFYQSLLRGLSASLSLELSTLIAFAGAVVVGVQYLATQGRSLRKLLKTYIFSQDVAFWNRHFSCSTSCYVLLINFGMVIGAAGYLLPIYLDSRQQWDQLLAVIRVGNDRIGPLSTLLSFLLCAGYLGGQVCLFGSEFKSMLYQQLRPLLSSFRHAPVRTKLSTGSIFLLALAMAVCPAGVSYYFFTEGIVAILGLQKQSTGLMAVGMVLSLPTLLQNWVTKGLRLVKLSYTLFDFCCGVSRPSPRGLRRQIEIALQKSDDQQPIPNNEPDANPVDITHSHHRNNRLMSGIYSRKQVFLTFCSFYLGLIAIVLVGGVKVSFELLSLKNNATEFIFSYLLGAVVALLLQCGLNQRLAANRISRVQEEITKNQMKSYDHSLTLSREESTLINLRLRQARTHLLPKQILFFLVVWGLGILAELLFYRLFVWVNPEDPSTKFRSECMGGLSQGLGGIMLLWLVLYCRDRALTVGSSQSRANKRNPGCCLFRLFTGNKEEQGDHQPLVAANHSRTLS